MKRKVLSLLLVAVPLAIFAQLKVDSDGKVYVAENSFSNAKLTIGDMYYYGLNYSNLNSRMTRSTGSYAYGIYSMVDPASSASGTGVGIYGTSFKWGTNIGVQGNVNSTYYGAGVYGSVGGSIPSTLASNRYAGYFNGATYVNGTLTATSVVNLSDIRLKENVQSLSKGGSSGSTLENVLNMNVIKYNFKQKVVDESEFNEPDKERLAKEIAAAEERNKITASQIHFGLSAQELQEIYPELVVEGQDGNFGINYIELVPILIRSIQELKQELDAVKGSGDAKTRSAYDEEDYKVVSTQNVLYQNNPNPFKEQTTIRFRLADDVQNASICIFDMSGKMLKKFPISSGMESVSVAGYELGEGMFLYALIVNGQVIDTKKMLITK